MRRAPQPRTNRDGHVSAPVAGLDTVSPAGAVPPGFARLCVNMLGAASGLQSRAGYREWRTAVGAGDVSSILPFNGSTSSADKLFAAIQDGIYDVTTRTASAPSKVLDFPVKDATAGWGTCQAFTNAAGNHYLLYGDEANGYSYYSETAGTWTTPSASDVTGVDPATLVAPLVFKHRVWFIQRGTAHAWYLGLDSFQGAATKFNFGSQFRTGGYLVGLFALSRDGGAGPDDWLVAVSSGGDVVVYQLTDPASPSGIAHKGTYQVGAPPAGRRVAVQFGGDLLIATAFGLVPVSALISETADSDRYPTRSIANLFASLVAERGSYSGWALASHPEENALLVLVPRTGSIATEQLALSVATKGWTRYADLPMLSAATWNRKLYFGTRDGRVCVHDGAVDNLLLSDANSYSAITYSGLTRSDNGGDARQKRIGSIRPVLMSEATAPAIAVEARYSYDATEITATPTAGTASGWGYGTWNSAVWTDGPVTSQRVFGATGIGAAAAIAWKGLATSRTTLVGFDLVFDEGGVL